MSMLFLDDSLERRKKFQSINPSAVCVETAEECIGKLKENKSIQFLFLDHDLGGKVFVDSNRADTGMEVVRWIVANSPDIEKIIVHSLNFSAAKEMVCKLQDAGYNAVYISWLDLIAGK